MEIKFTFYTQTVRSSNDLTDVLRRIPQNGWLESNKEMFKHGHYNNSESMLEESLCSFKNFDLFLKIGGHGWRLRGVNRLDGEVGKNTRKEGFGLGGDHTTLPICWSTYHLFFGADEERISEVWGFMTSGVHLHSNQSMCITCLNC